MDSKQNAKYFNAKVKDFNAFNAEAKDAANAEAKDLNAFNAEAKDALPMLKPRTLMLSKLKPIMPPMLKP